MSRFERLIGMVGGGLLIALLSSCRTVGVEEHSPETPSHRVDQSIVFLIHGDGDYLYHDADGTARQADEQAVSDAVRVAERNPAAEVFIFHQRRRKRLLFLFPRDDGTFNYYRGGKLIARETYRRGDGSTRLDPEVAYIREYAAEAAPGVRMLVYMGHEIPELDDIRYDGSRRSTPFGLSDFSRGLAGLTAGDDPFDLMILSTCYGGTPHTIRAMAPFAHRIVASPDNLHLSHLDVQALERLDLKLAPVADRWATERKEEAPAAADDAGDPVTDVARSLARQSFDRLADELQTVVTVAVYDVDRVRTYVDLVAPAYDSSLAALQGLPPVMREHVDCAEIEALKRPGMSEGVEIFYRPPRFGRRTDRSFHSGWQCWKEADLPR